MGLFSRSKKDSGASEDYQVNQILGDSAPMGMPLTPIPQMPQMADVHTVQPFAQPAGNDEQSDAFSRAADNGAPQPAYPPAYENGAPVVDVNHPGPGLTVTETSTGAKVEQAEGHTPYQIQPPSQPMTQADTHDSTIPASETPDAFDRAADNGPPQPPQHMSHSQIETMGGDNSSQPSSPPDTFERAADNQQPTEHMSHPQIESFGGNDVPASSPPDAFERAADNHVPEQHMSHNQIESMGGGSQNDSPPDAFERAAAAAPAVPAAPEPMDSAIAAAMANQPAPAPAPAEIPLDPAIQGAINAQAVTAPPIDQGDVASAAIASVDPNLVPPSHFHGGL